MDAVLTPAALNLTETAASFELPVVMHLRAAVAAQVQMRVAEDLTPPADWRRDSRLQCTCKDCTELSTFLDDPVLATWRFKAAEGRRQHVEHTIRSNHCDVDHTTDKDNRP